MINRVRKNTICNFRDYRRFLSLLIFIFSVTSINANKFNVDYTLDTYHLNKSGESGNTENIGLLIASYEYKTKKTRFHSSLALNHSTGSPTDNYLFDAQVISNTDTQGGEGLKPYELYLEHTFNSSLSLKTGLLDLSSFLNITESSLTLINSSFGSSADFAAAGSFGPAIYPVPTWGIVLEKKIKEFYSIASITDSIAEKNFDPSNVVLKPRIGSGNYNAALEFGYSNHLFDKLAFGLWRFKDSIDGQERSAEGGYLLIDKPIGKHSSFARLSKSTKEFEKMYQNIAFGFIYKSLFNKQNSLHVGFSSVSIESRNKKEKVFELLLNREFEHVNASFSYQRINSLGGFDGNGNVLTLRLVIGLSRS